MNMKNTLKTVALIALFASPLSLFADDSYLYWMISSTADKEVGGVKLDNWAYAKLKAGDSYLVAAEGGSPNFWADSYAGGPAATMHGDSAVLPSGFDYTTASYFIELYNESGTWLAQSDAIGYAALQEYIYASGQFKGEAFDFGALNFTNVPEPSSGMLMLIGMSLLALRRKNQKKA